MKKVIAYTTATTGILLIGISTLNKQLNILPQELTSTATITGIIITIIGAYLTTKNTKEKTRKERRNKKRKGKNNTQEEHEDLPIYDEKNKIIGYKRV
jgi:hypothetical protein